MTIRCGKTNSWKAIGVFPVPKFLFGVALIFWGRLRNIQFFFATVPYLKDIEFSFNFLKKTPGVGLVPSVPSILRWYRPLRCFQTLHRPGHRRTAAPQRRSQGGAGIGTAAACGGAAGGSGEGWDPGSAGGAQGALHRGAEAAGKILAGGSLQCVVQGFPAGAKCDKDFSGHIHGWIGDWKMWKSLVNLVNPCKSGPVRCGVLTSGWKPQSLSPSSSLQSICM